MGLNLRLGPDLKRLEEVGTRCVFLFLSFFSALSISVGEPSPKKGVKTGTTGGPRSARSGSRIVGHPQNGLVNGNKDKNVWLLWAWRWE